MAEKLINLYKSTPTDQKGIDLLKHLGVQVVKNGSDFLCHLPLIEAMAKSGMVTVLSTGMADVAEIDDAVKTFYESGGEELIVLHCTSSYPTPPADVNINKMVSIGRTFGVHVGFSDHSEGYTAAVLATLNGACWIEKHFTFDKRLAGPDHWFSSDEREFAEYTQQIRSARDYMGSYSIHPTQDELGSKALFRLSWVAARPLNKGHVICDSDITLARPGGGFTAKQKTNIVGRTLNAALPVGGVITQTHLE